jgi:hypothetical protein
MRAYRSLMCSATLFALCFVQSAFCQPKTVVTGLSYPVHIATDFVGGLYIVDQGCFQITPPGDCNVYKATLSGSAYSLTRLSAWTSSAKPLGVAVDNNGNVYTAVFGAGVYQQQPLSPLPTSSYSPPTLVINCPYVSQIAVDNHNNLLVVDTRNNSNNGAIVKESTNQAFVDCNQAENNPSTIVSVNLNTPQLVTTDAMGDVFTTLYGQQQLVKLTPSGGGYNQTLVTTTAPGNIAGIAMNSRQTGGPQLGDIFVTLGTYHQLVVEILSGGTYSQNVISNYHPGGSLQGVAVDGTNIFVVDAAANSVLQIRPPTPPTGLNGTVK